MTIFGIGQLIKTRQRDARFQSRRLLGLRGLGNLGVSLGASIQFAQPTQAEQQVINCAEDNIRRIGRSGRCAVALMDFHEALDMAPERVLNCDIDGYSSNVWDTYGFDGLDACYNLDILKTELEMVDRAKTGAPPTGVVSIDPWVVCHNGAVVLHSQGCGSQQVIEQRVEQPDQVPASNGSNVYTNYTNQTYSGQPLNTDVNGNAPNQTVYNLQPGVINTMIGSGEPTPVTPDMTSLALLAGGALLLVMMFKGGGK